jgi:VIT1/CCC1 family predicted Fe2+/Mn2+ transporter
MIQAVNMNHSRKTGFHFGLTSGVITTMGLMVGLDSSTGSSAVVISGILIIAITDALSDAMGIHISEESEGKHSEKEIWEATLTTFFSKFVFALTFLIPILLFQLSTAVIIGVVWGLLVITLSSLRMATETKGQKVNYRPVLEHLLIAIVVVVLTYYIGGLIRGFVH